jgi:glycosyltransferase involved in cell wall biosynthesis
MVNAEIPLTRFGELASSFLRSPRKLNLFNAEPTYHRRRGHQKTSGFWELRVSVSVVMPVKNGARHIHEAIESALSQGPDVAELIVVDDRSTDSTPEIVRAFQDPRIRMLTNDGSGVSAARNAGARSASGKWLLFLDADDRLRSGAVQELLKAALSSPLAVVAYGDYDRIDEEGRSIGRRALLGGRTKPSGQLLQRLAAGNFIVNGGVMIIRSATFAAAGGFDETLRYCEDWHCWCRLAALGSFCFTPRLLLDYRVHKSNTMNAALRSPRDYLPAVRRVFSDPAILAKLPGRLVPALERAAEVHLITYAAAQAVRFRGYRQAAMYALMAARRYPLATPRVTLRVGLAFLGI